MAVDALGLTILPDGCGERPPEWVRILSRVEPSCEIAEHRVVKVIGWDERGPRVRCSHGSFSPSSWVPADPPEPSDPEEVCPEFTHTGYCPDRLCERGCKHEAAWKVGDRVEHTIHGIGTIIDHLTAAKDRPYRVRFDQAPKGWGWFEAGDIQEAPPVSDTVKVEKEATDAPVWYRADEASAWANGWNACVRAAFTAEGADR